MHTCSVQTESVAAKIAPIAENFKKIVRYPKVPNRKKANLIKKKERRENTKKISNIQRANVHFLKELNDTCLKHQSCNKNQQN